VPPVLPLPALVVEDDDVLRGFLVSELEEMGYRVIAAGTGEEALEVLDREQMRLAVLDIGLPGIDGFSVADRLEHDVPVIFVTGDPVDAYARAHTRSLNYQVLPKPFHADLFQHAVRATA
jgi:two-component system, cell cycle response regulator CpdR